MGGDEKRLYTFSVVRLSFQPDHRDKIDTSEQWYEAMDGIKHQPNFDYVCKGESIDNELDVVLFIAWGNDANAPAAFLSGNIGCIISPLNPFVTGKPEIITLYRWIRGRDTRTFTTSGGGRQYMAEMMTVRGPVYAIHPTLREIEKRIKGYLETRMISLSCYNNMFPTLMEGCLFSQGEGREEHSDNAIFVLYLQWRGLEERDEFHDANTPDRALAPQLQKMFPSHFWQEIVVERLEKASATTSSWIYHKAEIVRDREGRDLVAS
ncbi:hypothetical protein V8C35DRAFT_301097 [Trichoderma chlorosporum]